MDKIVRSSITEQIFDSLKDKIISGEWKIGDKIPSEIELAEMLGVSRMSLRTAIQKLNILGLTETRIGEGTYVCEFSMKPYFGEIYRLSLFPNENEWNDMKEFKYALEDACIDLSIRKNTVPQYLEELKSIYSEFEETLKQGNMEELHDADFRFHMCICNMTENKMFVMLYNALSELLYDEYKESALFLINDENGSERLLDQHKKTIVKIESLLAATKYEPVLNKL